MRNLEETITFGINFVKMKAVIHKVTYKNIKPAGSGAGVSYSLWKLRTHSQFSSHFPSTNGTLTAN